MAEKGLIDAAANVAAVPAVQTAIRNARAGAGMAAFRVAFRADPACPGALNPVNAANDYIIDQFNHDHVTAAEAVAAYNNGWIYGREIGRTGVGVGPQVSVDNGAT